MPQIIQKRDGLKSGEINMESFRVFGKVEPTREKGLQKYSTRCLVDTVIYNDKKGRKLLAIFPLKRLPWNKKKIILNCFNRPFSWLVEAKKK